MSFINPDTGRKIKRGAATWRRLHKRGYRVVGERLLRPAHADLEDRAIQLRGVGANPLNLPANVTDDMIARHNADFDVLERIQQRLLPAGAPQHEPLTDAEADAVLAELFAALDEDDAAEEAIRGARGEIRLTRGSDPTQLLEPGRYYTLEVDGVLHTFPRIAADVRPPSAAIPEGEVTHELVEEILEFFADDPNLRLELVPVEDEPSIDEHGVISYRSFERLRLENHRELTGAVMAALQGDTLYSLYGRLGQHEGDGSPVAYHGDDRVQPLRIGNRLEEQNLGANIPRNSLFGIDTARWEKGRGYTAVIIWELRPMPVQAGPMGPFFAGAVNGELANCVLRVLRDKLLTGRAEAANAGRGHKPAGKRLAARRLAALTAADEAIAARGFTLDDVARLERDCEIRIRCRDAAGKDLLEQRPAPTGRAARHALIEVGLHDNHGWADLPTAPPKITEVATYDDRVTNASLAAAAQIADPAAQEAATTNALLDFVARVIPRGTRTWLIGAELVTHHGVLYRSQRAARAIDEMVAADAGVHPIDLDDFVAACSPEQAFKVNEAHDRATKMIGGAAAYRFAAWLERENIRPTPDKLRDIWQSAQVEAVVWHSDRDGSQAKHHHIDMRAAYLACDSRDYRADSEARDLIERYGFPDARTMRLARLDEAQPLTVDSPALQLTGAVQLTAWEFSELAHDYTPWRVGDHLRAHEGWITTPELYELLLAGDLKVARGRQVVYSAGAKEGLTFPPAFGSDPKSERDQAVRFVGKFARHADETSLVTHDKNEAAYLANAFGEAGRYLSHRNGAAYLVNYRSEAKRAQWFHMRAFVLAYTNIALRRMLRRFPRESVLRVCTDAIFAAELPPAVDALLRAAPSGDERIIKWGQWRLKAPGYVYYPMRTATQLGEAQLEHTSALPEAGLPINPAECDGVDASAVPRDLTGLLLATVLRLLITGQGGCGKTFVTATALLAAGIDFAIACPSNELALDHAAKLGCRTFTYHKLFALPVTKPMATWDPAALGHKLDRLPRVILWDEAGMVPTEIFERVLPYLRDRGIQVIALLGEGQLNPFADKAGPAAYLRDTWAQRVVDFDVDMRSQDDQIRDLKSLMWKTDDKSQLRIFRERVPEAKFDALLAEWTPQDLVLCSTLALGAVVGNALLARHREHFPQELAPIRYAPPDNAPRRSVKALIDVPGQAGRQVPAVRGTIEWVPLDTVLVNGLGAEWVYAGWSTIHCVQGKTINAPRRLYIVDHKLAGWLSNAVYTAVSRVRTFAQLRRVIPPASAQDYVMPAEGTLQADPCPVLIANRLRQHLSSDRQAKKVPEPADRLDVEFVIGMIVRQDGRCACCDCPLLLQGFTPRHPQAFSIDRLDDSRGHARDNVRLACYNCQCRHKA